MDIVYAYRHDPRSGNAQIIYSLRSVEKHLSGVGKVFVIGTNPKLPGVYFIPHEDNLSAAKNISNKLQAIAHNDKVSDGFLYISDDHYLLKDMEAKDYPIYFNGTLRDLMLTQRNSYKAFIKNTAEALEAKGLTTYNFNVHCPVIYNKSRLRELASIHDLTNPLGYLSKSLYLNTFKPYEIFRQADCKIRTDFSIVEIAHRIEGRDCWSTGQEWKCPNIEKALSELYPDKSKWE